MSHSNFNMYENPLIDRYASKEMLYLFSPQKKFSTWRKLWVALAEAERQLGLPISEEQVEEMRTNVENIDFALAAEYEKKLRHDVMAHVHTFGECCPKAKQIIHLGATSAYVGDNTDILIMKEALTMIQKKLVIVMHNLAKFAQTYRELPTLGFTHLQPAQLTTVGKRACLWIQDLLLDLELSEYIKNSLKLRGVKGTTGTQASFLALFDGDREKVLELERIISQKFGLASYSVTGQTYSRKVDSHVLSVLSSVSQSLHKMTNDLRILQSLKEVEEPFETSQIGSSAMAYKRNPMRCERISSLAKFVISLSQSGDLVASTQWMERTLDDSANRRLANAQCFLAVDAALDIANNVTRGLVVYPGMIEKHIREELPFMATENIIMECVKKGGDRQDLHESIRVLSMQAGENVKGKGQNNNLIQLILSDSSFDLHEDEIMATLNPEYYIGMAPTQVDHFLNELKPIFDRYRDCLDREVELVV